MNDYSAILFFSDKKLTDFDYLYKITMLNKDSLIVTLNTDKTNSNFEFHYYSINKLLNITK